MNICEIEPSAKDVRHPEERIAVLHRSALRLLLDATLDLGSFTDGDPLAWFLGDGFESRAAETIKPPGRGSEGRVGGVEAGEVFLDCGHDPPLLVERRKGELCFQRRLDLHERLCRATPHPKP